MNDHLFGKELFILFAASAFRKLSSIYVFSYFPFGFEGRMWDLIVSVPDHCLSFYFPNRSKLLSLGCKRTDVFREGPRSLTQCIGRANDQILNGYPVIREVSNLSGDR